MKSWAALLACVLVLGGLALAGGFTWWSGQMYSVGLTVTLEAYLGVGAILFAMAAVVLALMILARRQASR